MTDASIRRFDQNSVCRADDGKGANSWGRTSREIWGDPFGGDPFAESPLSRQRVILLRNFKKLVKNAMDGVDIGG
jgi:hypothetical protein